MLSIPLLRLTLLLYKVRITLLFGQKKRLKFPDNKFMLCCIHTSNLRVHTSIFTVYEKKLVEVSVRKNFGVIMNSFSQFHSTFIRKHSRFFVRVGHKPQSVVYKVCPVEIKISLNFLKKMFQKTFCKNVPIFVGSIDDKKTILLNANHLFAWHKMFVGRFLVWHKTYGPAQNILGPVKGQGIR